MLLLLVGLFMLRMVPYMVYLDFVIVAAFAIVFVALFNIVRWRPLVATLSALGRESMNMWFLHALFATTVTATTFAPLLAWVQPKALHIAVMVVISYYMARAVTALYNAITR